MQPVNPIVFNFPAAPAPVAVATTPASRWQTFAIGSLLLVVAALAFDRFSNRNEPGPGPGPAPVPVVSVVDAVEDATRAYAENLAKSMDKLADDVVTKRITNWDQIKNNARAYTEAARVKAFEPVNVLDTASIPSGEFTGVEDKVAAYLKTKAEGHRRVAK